MLVNVSLSKPRNLRRALTLLHTKSVVTIRILGKGEKENVLSSSNFKVTSDMLEKVPVVIASSVLNVLMTENPSLVVRLHDATVPHWHFKHSHDMGSLVLLLARKLSNGKLDFRQFQNNFFASRSEAILMYDAFLSVRAIMARDERLEGLCSLRMKNSVSARYVEIRIPPMSVDMTEILNSNIFLKRHVVPGTKRKKKHHSRRPHHHYHRSNSSSSSRLHSTTSVSGTTTSVAFSYRDHEGGGKKNDTTRRNSSSGSSSSSSNDDGDDGRGSGKDGDEDGGCGAGGGSGDGYTTILSGPSANHDLDVVLYDGTLLNLDAKNSVFVNEYMDFFAIGNILDYNGDVLRLSFDNYDHHHNHYDHHHGHLPKYCLYEKSPLTCGGGGGGDGGGAANTSD